MRLTRLFLVDLKYVVKGQVFEVPFEGRPRVFRIVGVESDEESTQEVSQNLASLSLADSPNWSEIVQNAAELDWDTQVEVTEEPKSKVHTSSSLSFHTSPTTHIAFSAHPERREPLFHRRRA
ncbi:hypothetical protein FRC12_010995 [Ceratobasidium sp. 428]|nr:hypothetical protein FRC12_010995 [Ceratobasidium sp. 428]